MDAIARLKRLSSATSSASCGISYLERQLSEAGSHCSSASSDRAVESEGPLGLTLLFTPPEPLIDFIFVHGLGGGSRKTWSKTADPTHHWPKEWLPNEEGFERVRIHSFGYNSNWSKRNGNVLDVRDFGRSLLGEIHNSPVIRRDNTRIIFIGHSMGGLVIKQAYIFACQDMTFQDLVPRFDTIFFLATPHRGADAARVLGNLLRVSHGTRAYLADLEKDSRATQSINDEFRHWADRISLWSFYESRKTNIGVSNILVVGKSSATLGYPRERTAPLNCDHRSICKFEHRGDPNYQTLRNAFLSVIDTILNTTSVSTDGEVQRQLRLIERYLGIYETPEDDLNSLKDNQMPGTCEWFTEKESFQHWSSFAFNSSRIFWLNGNPGAGKSVLASFIVHYLRNLGRDCSYYFFKHGDGDRASLSNCLSSLAYQMALLNPQVRKEILIMHDNDVRLDTDNARALWRTLFLSGIFKSNYFRPQFLILDALDECNDLADLFPMLAKIQAQVPLRILITSRKTFELSKLFSPLGLQLSTEEITPLDSLDDIKHYVKAHRQHLLFTSNDDYENIERQILHKSSGCFLWVKLILNELEQAWSEEEGREILNEVPTDMDEIYYRILDNLSKISRGKRFVKAALTWIVCANRPLTVPELEHALKLDTNDSIHSLERLLTSACGQLIQIDRNSRVQMIHQTARDYLLKDNLQSEFAINKSISHGRLAEVCLKYLVSRDMERPRSLKQISVTRHHPRSLFADYACTSFSDHLGQAHPGEERFVDLLELHFNSNVLAWVEYIASTGDLYRLPQAVKNLKSYLSRCLKCNPSLNLRVQSLEQWTTDLIRVSTKFGKVILTLPNAIYDLIPPFCPSESMIFKSSGARSHGLLITGLQSTTWDDCLACIDHHGDQTTAIACSEKLFAIGLSSGRTVLYHKSSCHKHVALEHPETVNLLEFGTLTDVVASSGKKTIIVWSTTTGANLWTLQPSHEPLTLTFSENDTLLSAATKQNFFTTWDLRQESELRTLPWHDSYENEETAMRQVPTNAAVCPEKRLLAIVYRGRPITLWDLFTNSFFGFCGRGSSGRPAAVRCPIEAMVFNPNPRANILVAAYADGDIAIFDPWQCEVKQLIEADAQTLACSPDGRTLAAGNSFGTVQIFDFGDSRRASLTLLYQIDAHGFCVKALAFSQDSLQFMALHGSQCRIWEPSALVRKDKSEDLGDTSSVQAQTVYIDTRVSREITAIACHPLDNIVFCGKDDGTVSVYHTSNGKQISQLYIHTKGLAVTKLIWGSKEDILVSTDLSSRFMVRKIQQKGLKCWEASEPVIDTHTQHAINQVILSPDNNYVLISTELADFLWDIEGRLVRSLTSQLRSTWRWANHPADSQRLIYFSPVSTCIRNWSNLEVLETLDGSLDRISLGAQEVIQTVLPCCNGKKLVVELWLHKWSHFASRLLILNTPSAQDGEPSLSSFGDMSAAVAYPIGILGNELFFLDREMFVCSVDIEASDSCYFRHFFIPYDWFDSTSRPLCHITSGKDIVFGKRGELAVIKGGFSSKERVPLS